MGTHTVEFRESAEGEKGAFRIGELLHDRKYETLFTKPTIAGPTGQEFAAPDGSLREHLRKQAATLGGETAYVKLVIHYTPEPGERLSHGPSLPPGFRVVPKK